MLSNMTPIIELPLGTTARQGPTQAARVDGALGEDGLDGERCVVINRIRSSCCARRRSPSCAPGRQDLRSRARPPGTRRGEALLGHGGAPMAGPPSSPIRVRQWLPSTAIHAHGLIRRCDYRIPSEGALEFSLNEVPIGHLIRAVYCEIIKHAVWSTRGD
jgi:hypothetical protein